MQKDIIITGLQRWDISIGSNCKNIAQEFAKENRVLYVNPPQDRISAILKKSTGNFEYKLSQIHENLWVLETGCILESISRLPINKLFDILNNHNNKLFAKSITKAINQLQFKNHIHFCDSDIFRSYYLKDLLKPSLYIYYSRDNLLAVPYWQVQGNRIEPLHMEKADLVVTNSPYLTQRASQWNAQSHFVGQGCDLSSYNGNKNYKKPADLASIKGQIVGYIGSLNSLRLDIQLLQSLAQRKPEWQFVFVGPEDQTFQLSHLHSTSNVHFLGPKNEKELPEYLAHFDVAINPQRNNEVTIGNYPRKIDEYLAMGLPTVATKTQTMAYFGKYVPLASDTDEWEEAIAYELENNSIRKKTERMAFAHEHSWENNVSAIYNAIENYIAVEIRHALTH